VFDLPVGRVGQPGKHVVKVDVRIDPAAVAALDDRVDDRATLAGFGVSEDGFSISTSGCFSLRDLADRVDPPRG